MQSTVVAVAPFFLMRGKFNELNLVMTSNFIVVMTIVRARRQRFGSCTAIACRDRQPSSRLAKTTKKKERFN